jgi:sortase (surface protein transpeptidase)
MQSTDDERLTLVTCWPADSNTHRLIIVARAVEKRLASSGPNP